MLELPSRVWKNSRLRRPSQRQPMAAQTDIFDQLKAWIRTGVSPFVAQVRRIEAR